MPPARNRILAQAASLALLAGLGGVQILRGAVIPENGGLGFDGVIYARIAREPGRILSGQLDAYSAQRVVPSLAVRLLLELSGTPAGDEAIRLGFAAWNLALLLATGALWWHVAEPLGLGRVARWLGFCLLFLNLGNLRLPFYCAPLTDTTAFALGAALVCFHLRRSDTGMLATLFLGALTWRSFLFLGAPLYLWPRGPLAAPAPSAATAWPAVSGALLALGVVARALGVSGPGEAGLSVAIPTALLGAVVLELLLGAGLRRPVGWRVSPGRLLVVLGLLGAVLLLIWAMSRGQVSPAGALPSRAYPIGLFVVRDVVGRGSLSAPAEFLANHLRFYGTLPLMTMLLWRPLCRAAHELGAGMTLYLGMHLLMLPSPESRQMIDGLFGLVLAVAGGAAAARLPGALVGVVALLGFVSSAVWLPGAWAGDAAGAGGGLPAWLGRLAGGSPVGRQALFGLAALAATGMAWVLGRRRLPPRRGA